MKITEESQCSYNTETGSDYRSPTPVVCVGRWGSVCGTRAPGVQSLQLSIGLILQPQPFWNFLCLKPHFREPHCDLNLPTNQESVAVSNHSLHDERDVGGY